MTQSRQIVNHRETVFKELAESLMGEWVHFTAGINVNSMYHTLNTCCGVVTVIFCGESLKKSLPMVFESHKTP